VVTPNIDLSICIVTYNARDYLADSLKSIYQNTGLEFEVIVVDNGSTDSVAGMLRENYPEIHLIQNDSNAGYTRPMNQALKAASGRYLVQLNPDTLILPEAFDRLVQFMQADEKVGICGPKVLNQDGTLQKPCRRGESRPWAVVSYFSGLYALFPKSKFFGGYLMNYMGEDETHEVAGVSGSCMLICREVVDQIGYLDEIFFAYQEDADYCFRAKQAGWKVFYVPAAKIIHYGGKGGSRVKPFRSIYEWHRSYWLFYKKNYASDYPFIFNWFYYLAIILKLGYSLLLNSLRREKYAGPKR
jgi:GT2 family glycosyltransferase